MLSYQLSVVSCQLSVFSHQCQRCFSAFGFWLLAFGYSFFLIAQPFWWRSLPKTTLAPLHFSNLSIIALFTTPRH